MTQNPTAGHIPEETRIKRDTCTPIFIAALFTIARAWKQPRSIDSSEVENHGAFYSE